MTLRARQEAALEPVRAAMVNRARQDAATTVARARDAAAAMIAQAQRDADAAVASAREDGIAQAEPIALAELSRSRQAARAVTLGAEAAIRDEVVRRIKDAVLALREEPGYSQLRERLSALAARTAGPGAVLTEHEMGGMVAIADGVTVNCSLPRLAEVAVEKLDARITALCAAPHPAQPGQKDEA
jgi:vacuolar-type H+-ATPase subunit E/Vma4